MGVGGQRHASATLSPGKDTRYPLNRRLCGHQGRSGRVQKIWPPPQRDSITGPASRNESLYRLSYPDVSVCFYQCVRQQRLLNPHASRPIFYLTTVVQSIPSAIPPCVWAVGWADYGNTANQPTRSRNK